MRVAVKYIGYNLQNWNIIICLLYTSLYDIANGDEVEIYNNRGSVKIKAYYDDEVQQGTLVTLGVWWQSQSSDTKVAINALMSDRPTDQGWGSTFYDVQVHIRKLS